MHAAPQLPLLQLAVQLSCQQTAAPLPHTARKLVELLRELASAGRCVITTIHQVRVM